MDLIRLSHDYFAGKQTFWNGNQWNSGDRKHAGPTMNLFVIGATGRLGARLLRKPLKEVIR